jgi:RimJ/RimL family protein N-acetyltransferase
MMKHLGGPESTEKLRKRHQNYVALSANPATGCMFVITVGPEKIEAGTIGYWEKDFDGQKVWETGWNVLPEFQGRGIATAAASLIVELASKLEKHKFLCAFPSVNNRPSNAICRRVGFTLEGETDFEYPPGSMMRCNVWRLDISKP